MGSTSGPRHLGPLVLLWPKIPRWSELSVEGSMEFNWTLFAQYLILGVTNGALIALIALGYTLVYGIVELINFAHGEVFMMGAFLSLTAVGALGVAAGAPWWQIALISLVGLLAAMLFSGVLNWSIDRVVYR